MPLRKEITKGIEALLRDQNSDGGIPATSPEQASGCWTSADTLEAIFVTGTLTKYGLTRIKKIVDFLLDTQIGSAEIQTNITRSRANAKLGSWSLFRGQEPSPMATGHAVAALTLASNFFDLDAEFQKRILKSIKAGFDWLQRNQNEDGGWGTHPHSGVLGKESSIIAVLYALLPYKYTNQTMHNSNTVQKAVAFLTKRQNGDGSWSAIKSVKGDACNTARAISCLQRAEHPDKACIKRGIDYILANQIPELGLWEIVSERYDYENAPAQVILNNNTNCDVMVALMESEYFGKESFELLGWLLKTQKDNGYWHLSSPTQSIDGISTWSTSEWVYAVNAASIKLLGNKAHIFSKEPFNWYKLWLFVLSVGYILNLYSLFKNEIISYWEGRSQDVQFLILGSILFAFFVAVLANFFTDWLRRNVRNALVKLKKWYYSKFRKN